MTNRCSEVPWSYKRLFFTSVNKPPFSVCVLGVLGSLASKNVCEICLRSSYSSNLKIKYLKVVSCFTKAEKEIREQTFFWVEGLAVVRQSYCSHSINHIPPGLPLGTCVHKEGWMPKYEEGEPQRWCGRMAGLTTPLQGISNLPPVINSCMNWLNPLIIMWLTFPSFQAHQWVF